MADEFDYRASKRRWIKLYVHESLYGSIRFQLTVAERATWYDLLLFAGACSNTGDICDRDGRPFPDSYIANRLNVTMPLFRSTVQKCLDEGRLTQDESGYHITNWVRYQSEYDRQKKYRQQEALTLEQDDIVDLNLAEVTKLYQDNIGLVTGQMIADELKALSENYPLDAIREAFRAAVRNNKRSLAYITNYLKKSPGKEGTTGITTE